ncbi:hypothetical protein, partial [Burkholderia sp. WSM2232]|uniref:hypothetical protein n=1 Tax=Burkholderia sp. WSM2232 TaxID=944436 RepID=UPI00054D96B3
MLGREPRAWFDALAQHVLVRSLKFKRPYVCGQENSRKFVHDTFVIVDHASQRLNPDTIMTTSIALSPVTS